MFQNWQNSCNKQQAFTNFSVLRYWELQVSLIDVQYEMHEVTKAPTAANEERINGTIIVF